MDRPESSSAASAFLDEQRVAGLTVPLRRCDPEGPPRIELIGASRLGRPTQLSAFPGSFNPPTVAHLALARAAESAGLGPLLFVYATRTIDKERPEGAIPEDRLLMLDLLAESGPARAIAVVNRGLYVDQAELIHAAFPALERLWFLVGFDKIVQIFDRRYYDDPDAALEKLFALASFAVAPRDGAAGDELTHLLAESPNRRYADRVRHLPVSPSLASVSSTAAREAVAHGSLPADQLPSVALEFIQATGCYLQATVDGSGRRVDRYAERSQRIARLAGS